ncbi:MAG TPA: beta-ketoacyl-ACP synthase II [Methylocystis sp.]|nr:beta-ketoacyl-ACP synthase II [Methylocystis sp.]
MRRVVVTGLGLVSPLGCGVEVNWRRLTAGECGFKRIENFEVSDLPCQIAGQVPRVGEGGFNADDWFDPKEQRKVDDFIIFAAAAATQALADAGWKADTPEKQEATGVLIGSGIGGLGGIYETSLILKEKGPRRVSPFFISGRIINLAAGYVSIMHGLRGPNHAVVTACATGTHAIADAARLIALGEAEVMVAGGAESPVNRIGVAGFCACRALSTGFNDRPEAGSRPYDRDRDGFVMGEGAGCVVLETLEHAKARGAKILAEIVGWGMSGDAHHITAPAPDGDGAYRCMQAALKRAGVSVDEIDYVNAHGTSTPLGDEIELNAVERLLGNSEPKLSMSSTKSAIGHLLGAAGAVEAIYTVLALRDQIAPPTRNLDNPSVETAIDLVPHAARRRKIDLALSNSFGFGGTNASLVLRRSQ